MVLASGPAHGWAVSFALTINYIMQALRKSGRFTEDHLPLWVSGTERASESLMSIWFLASFALAYLRMMQTDDHAQGLPTNSHFDFGVSVWLGKVYSPWTRWVVQGVHVFSCLGFFLCTSVLCAGILFANADVVSACDVCLILNATAFAVPHLLVALHRVGLTSDEQLHRFSLAMASEAGILGPQLCLIWSCVDIDNKASFLRRCLYTLTALANVISLVACGRSPRQIVGKSVAPDIGGACLSLCTGLCAAVLTFKNKNLRFEIDGITIFGSFLMLFMFASLSVKCIRSMILDVFEPIMPLQARPEKIRHDNFRDVPRIMSHVLVLCTLACISTPWVWSSPSFSTPSFFSYDSQKDRSSPQDHYVSTDDHDEHSHKEDWWDHYDSDHVDTADRDDHYDFDKEFGRDWADTKYHDEWNDQWNLLRWLGQEPPAEAVLLDAISEAMKVPNHRIQLKGRLDQHRVLSFKLLEGSHDQHDLWRRTVAGKSNEVLARLADSTFPPELNLDWCQEFHDNEDGQGRAESPSPERVRQDAQGGLHHDRFTDESAMRAYRAVCQHWLETEHSHSFQD